MMIQLKSVAKAYGKKHQFPVLRQIDLSVQTGEHVAIVGRSGSGKTTLLNILGGLCPFDSGTYTFNGQPVDLQREAAATAFRRTNIGFVLQNFALLFDRSVRENVLVGLDHYMMCRREKCQIVDLLLAAMDIQDLRDKNPADLSGGECQRVAIARTLAKDPPIILADEPTGALDAATEQRVLDYLFAQQRTIVLATHNPAVAARCHRIVRIEEGVLV